MQTSQVTKDLLYEAATLVQILKVLSEMQDGRTDPAQTSARKKLLERLEAL